MSKYSEALKEYKEWLLESSGEIWSDKLEDYVFGRTLLEAIEKAEKYDKLKEIGVISLKSNKAYDLETIEKIEKENQALRDGVKACMWKPIEEYDKENCDWVLIDYEYEAKQDDKIKAMLEIVEVKE